jgi:hypothetical protein
MAGAIGATFNRFSTSRQFLSGGISLNAGAGGAALP